MKGFMQVTALAAAFLLMPGVAAAQQSREVECGEVITQSTRLASDVGPCAGEGIVVGADKVKLDLNGHRVFGTRIPARAPASLSAKGETSTSPTAR